jgi:superfamily II DNA or RNA helicase
MQLRPYQIEAEAAIRREWDTGNKRTLLVLPTGTGKTIVFCKLAENVVRDGGKVLILAHRGELLEQAADKLSRATGLGCSVEKAESSSLGEWYQVTVGSVQTLTRPKRLEAFKPDHFQAVIVDEAHHALADSYQRVLQHFAPANVLGVTATPNRGDMKELGTYFDSLAYEYSLPKAIKEEFLCPIKAMTIPIKLDLSSVKQTAGDYNAADVGSALDPYLEQIADEMAEHCGDRKTVVFLPLIATSQKFAGMLAERGMTVAEVNGKSQDRTEILQDFDAGRYQVLCNSMLLTEGWDCPSVDCIVCLRPTKIRSLYCQMIGRGTRIHPGKDHLLLLDFLWLSERHELCRPAHLLAPDKDVADKMTENIAVAGAPVDLEEAEAQAEGDCVNEREEALAAKLREMRNRKKKLVDPLQYEMSIQAEDLSNYVPAFGWEAVKPDAKQLDLLEKSGIYPDAVDSAGLATKLLDRLDKRRTDGLTTPKQIRFLEARGFQHVGGWEFESARKLIDRIAASNWRTPNSIDPKTYQPARKAAV